MNDRINKIIQESIRTVLSEMDIVPTDAKGDADFGKRKSANYWKMIYRFMDNVKAKMDIDSQAKNGNISVEDVNEVVDYICNGLNNITGYKIMRQ